MGGRNYEGRFQKKKFLFEERRDGEKKVSGKHKLVGGKGRGPYPSPLGEAGLALSHLGKKVEKA